ncbi:MAG: hypothetical protein ACYST6_16335 [Planctomycetota bacterium]|jgi:hypothetical protein
MKKSRVREFGGMAASAAFVLAALWCNGCGFVSIFGTPTRHEIKIPAEYDLAQRQDERILVLVNQPGWLQAQSNLKYHLTERLNENLTSKAAVLGERVVSYDSLWKFRSAHPGFSRLSAVEVGAALDAGLVLFVAIEAYEVEKAADTNYYKGLLGVRGALYDTVTKENLWPKQSNGKRLVVGFDIESHGQEVAVQRLSAAAAHCTVRYLYNCPKDEFAISDDKSHIHW